MNQSTDPVYQRLMEESLRFQAERAQAIFDLRAERDALRAENKQLRAYNEMLLRIERQNVAENERLRAALRHIADHEIALEPHDYAGRILSEPL